VAYEGREPVEAEMLAQGFESDTTWRVDISAGEAGRSESSFPRGEGMMTVYLEARRAKVLMYSSAPTPHGGGCTRMGGRFGESARMV
jgi:hypothetical protein